ncbi:MAG: thiol-disulfide oxidoreductase DCC family protein [Acidimicrobiales bacterium]
MEQPVIIFDGVCNLCNATVDFIIRRDRDAVFQFAPNQSEAGEEIVRQANLDVFEADTLVLWENGSTYVRSTAVLRIARRLGMPWRLAYGFIVIPRPIRDFFYRMLAKNRYRICGKRDNCRVPTPEERTRFLQ